MRIAISGTHSQGKSTFVNDWTNRHHRYIREEEPFRALHDEGYDIRFRQESTRLHNGIQMYYNISRLMSYQQDSDCIFSIDAQLITLLIRNTLQIMERPTSMINFLIH